MGRLSVFNNISVDGYYVDAHGEMTWAHRAGNDPEWARFAAQNSQTGDGVLLFGRKTYELMVAFWPTDEAKQRMPEVAEGMNRRRKVVASRSLDKVTWSNTSVLRGDLADEVRKLKAGPSPIVILGSGTIIAQLASQRLIDEYTLVVVPVVLGSGRTMFESPDSRFELRRTGARVFDNGNVVMTYEPA